MHTLFTLNISEFTAERLEPVFFYACSYKISPNLLKHSCDTMSFIGTRPRLKTLQSFQLTLHKMRVKKVTCILIKKNKKNHWEWGASAQIFKKRKLLYLMHKNPLPIAKKKKNQIHMLHSSMLAKTCTAN